MVKIRQEFFDNVVNNPTMKSQFLCVGAFLLQHFLVCGQQININPAFVTDGVYLRSMDISASNEMVFAGSIFTTPNNKSCVVKTSGANSVFAKFFPDSQLDNVKVSPDGSIVVAGLAEQVYVSPGVTTRDCLLAKLDPLGNVLWAKSAGTIDSSEWVRGLCVSDAGDIIVAIDKRPETSPFMGYHEAVARFDSNGNLVWVKNLALISGVGNSTRIKPFVRNDTVFVFATGSDFTYNKGIFLTMLRLSDGNPLGFFTYDDLFDDETLLDVVPFQGGFAVSYYSENGNTLSLFRTSGLNIVITGVALMNDFVNSFNPASYHGFLATDGASIFLSSSVNLSNSGDWMTFGVSFNANLNPVWIRNIAGQVSLNTEVGVFDQNIYFLDRRLMSAENSITLLKKSDGSPNAIYCNVSSVLNLELSPTQIIRRTITRLVNNSQFVVYDYDHDDYAVNVVNCTLTPVPVTLVSFTGWSESKSVLLDWTTASEENSSHFNVLCSSDMGHWEVVGSVSSAGNSRNMTRYRFEDLSPKRGTSYYKLEQVDFDDSAEYSDAIAVSFGPRDENFFFPNPLTAGEILSISGEFESIEVFDQIGRIVPFQRLGNTVQIFASSGVYYVALTKNGFRRATTLIIR